MSRFLTIVVCSIILFCAQEVYAQSELPPSPAVLALVAAQNRFGFSLFRKLAAREPDQNVVLCPTGTHMLLSMAYIGAEGATRKAMADMLNLESLSDAALNAAASSITDDYATIELPIASIHIANSLWANKGCQYLIDYLYHCDQTFQASAQILDMQQPTASGTIDRWIKANTRGDISQIDTRLSGNDSLCLIGTTKFQACWKTPFLTTNTKYQPFTIRKGTTCNVPMMYANDLYTYGETDKAQVIQISFSGVRFCTEIVLPNQGISLTSLIDSLNPSAWADIAKCMTVQHGQFFMPRTNLHGTLDLDNALSEIGMQSAYSSSADFSGMLKSHAHISHVTETSALSFDENGVEVPARTIGSVTQSRKMTQYRLPFRMVVDHPYLCAIIDRQTGSILFLAAVYNPNGAKPTTPSHGAPSPLQRTHAH